MAWKIDRPFTYEGVNGYYTNKIAAFPIEPLPQLPEATASATQTFSALATHFHHIANEMGLSSVLYPCDKTPYLWGQVITRLSPELQPFLWRFREYVFCMTMLFLSTSQPQESSNRLPPPTFRLEQHSFTIVGSAELTSDIDITIQGPHASYLIARIEDLYQSLTQDYGIPIRCWDVEFYGDFRFLRSVFANSYRWTAPQRVLLLKYALVSYFRSTHQTAARPPHVHPIIIALLDRALRVLKTRSEPQWLNQALRAIVAQAYAFWRQTAPNGILNRELFYQQLQKVESDTATLRILETPQGLQSNNTSLEPQAADRAFDLFTALALANIHRAESYILPSTAVHVVEWEQKKKDNAVTSIASTEGLPRAWFASNARIGIDPFGFLLSAIEQFGYLEHYHPQDTPCSKKGVKYFGRFVRALLQAGLLPATTPLQLMAQKLNQFRATKYPTVPCPYDIHLLLRQVLDALVDTRSKAPKRQKGGKSGRRGRYSSKGRNRTHRRKRSVLPPHL